MCHYLDAGSVSNQVIITRHRNRHVHFLSTIFTLSKALVSPLSQRAQTKDVPYLYENIRTNNVGFEKLLLVIGAEYRHLKETTQKLELA